MEKLENKDFSYFRFIIIISLLTFASIKANEISGLKKFGRRAFAIQNNLNATRNRILSPFPIAVVLNLLRMDVEPLSAQEIGDALGLIGPSQENITNYYTNYFEKMDNSSLISMSFNMSILADGQELVDFYMEIDEIIKYWDTFHICYRADDLTTTRDKKMEIEIVTHIEFHNRFHYHVDTIESIFFSNIKGNKKTMTTLRHVAKLRYGVIEPLNASAVEVPTSDDQTLLYIIYPHQREKGIIELEKKLRKYSFDRILAYLTPTNLNLIMPKLEMKTVVPLKETFKAMGMKQMFQNMCESSKDIPIKLKRFVLKASFIIDERNDGVHTIYGENEGDISRLIQLKISHPFIFFVASKDHDIWFMGKVCH